MKKTKTKNENSEKSLKKVDEKSKAIISHEDKKNEALKMALAAKTKQLKKNPHAINKKQLKEKKKELLDSIKKEKETEEKPNKKKSKTVTEGVSDASPGTDSAKPKKKKKNKSTSDTNVVDASDASPKPKKKKNKPNNAPFPKLSADATLHSLKLKKKKQKELQEAIATNTDSAEPTKKKKKDKKKKSTGAEDASQESVDPAKKKKKKTKVPKSPEEAQKLSDPECTVFVGNLGQNIKKQQLITLFKTYGNVISVRLRTALGNTIFKHKSRKETECLNAYVVMDSPENAQKSLELSGTEFRGRHIRVTKSLKGNFLSDESSKRTVFVGNLKFKVTEETLHELFSSCGEIEAVRTMKNDKGCKGIGYVIFKSKEGVHLAQELNGTLVFGRPVRVEKYSTKKVADKAASKPKKEKNLDGKPKPKKAKNDDESKKKGDFRGVKTNMKKKKFNKKKLGGNPVQRKLAKKIAPKET